VGKPQKTAKKRDVPIADVISRLQGFAPEMEAYIDQVKRHKRSSWRHHLRRLLALKVNYHVDDILLAVRRAGQYKVFDAGTIEGFLENNSEPRYSAILSFRLLLLFSLLRFWIYRCSYIITHYLKTLQKT